jgi:hypothetical protein
MFDLNLNFKFLEQFTCHLKKKLYDGRLYTFSHICVLCLEGMTMHENRCLHGKLYEMIMHLVPNPEIPGLVLYSGYSLGEEAFLNQYRSLNIPSDRFPFSQQPFVIME